MINFTYGIINIDNDLLNVDFSQICETSPYTIRPSTDGELTIIRWETEPTFITSGLVVPSKIMNQTEMYTEMNTDEWTLKNPLPPPQ